MTRNGSVAQTPASTGVCVDHGQDLAGHLHDDRVGVAVGHQPGEAPPARHPEPARVVDDDQVDPAGLGALGARGPVPAPPPMIGRPSAIFRRNRSRISLRVSWNMRATSSA